MLYRPVHFLDSLFGRFRLINFAIQAVRLNSDFHESRNNATSLIDSLKEAQVMAIDSSSGLII